jgi:hypothetical protein
MKDAGISGFTIPEVSEDRLCPRSIRMNYIAILGVIGEQVLRHFTKGAGKQTPVHMVNHFVDLAFVG